MNNILTIFEFAPLIQLWAGICLLFFYENLFRVTPFAHFVRQYENRLNTFLQQYGELKDFPKPKYSIYWKERVWPAIKSLACLLFCFSIILLFYIGLNKNTIESNKFLFVISCWFFFYEMIFLAAYKNRIFRSYVLPTIWVILGIIISLVLPKTVLFLFFYKNLSCILLFFEIILWMIFYEIIFGIMLYQVRKFTFFRKLWFRFLWLIIGLCICIITPYFIHIDNLLNVSLYCDITIFTILTCFGGFFIVTFLMFRELWLYNRIVSGLENTQEIVEIRAKFLTDTNNLLKASRKLLISIEAKIQHPIIKKEKINGKITETVNIEIHEKADVIEAINEYFREEVLKVYYPYMERYMIQ